MFPLQPAPAEELAAEHIRGLVAAADRSRLIALARCCQPAAWRLVARRVHTGMHTWLHAGHLRPAPSHCTAC